ncbi:MAG TPA: TIGR01906 family membrane protein [Anaerolineales bacterium]|nr:TIGR01906 family membrane protein [Anaerolineales bacterium]HLO28056.1 TIGR01906 family membrane protein [Anaerolineales bacterium]
MAPQISKTLKLLIMLLIPIVTIIATVRLLATDQYLAFEYGKPSFPPDPFGFTEEQRFDLASSDIHYVRGHLPNDTLSKETLNSALVYNPREVSHMADVRAVFRSVFRVWQVALLLLFLMGLTLWQKRERAALGSALQWGGILTAGMILFVGLLAVFAWQFWFSTFHLFFFEPGSWLFYDTDTLIRLFPVKFWFDATLTVSVLSLIGGLFIALFGRQWRIAIIKVTQKIQL